MQMNADLQEVNERSNCIIFNNQKVFLKTETEAVRLFEAHFKSGNIDATIECADEQSACLLLETFINLEVSNQSASRKTVRYFRFKQCRFDERFFALLGSDDSKHQRIQRLHFAGDCRVNLTDVAHLEKVTRAILALGPIDLYVSGGGIRGLSYNLKEYDFQIELCSRSRLRTYCDGCTTETTLPFQEWPYGKSFSQISIRTSDRPAVSDVPLMFLASNLPNVTGVKIWCECTRGFIDRLFHEIRRRPTWAAPCELHMRKKSSEESYFISKLLDCFNELKSTRMYLRMTYADMTDMKSFLTRVLEVVRGTVHLTEIYVDLEYESDFENFSFLASGIRKIVPRIRPLRLVPQLATNLSKEQVDELIDEIEEIYRRSFINMYQNLLLMISVKILHEIRIGECCFLRMLPIDVFRKLHGFICDTRNIGNSTDEIDE